MAILADAIGIIEAYLGRIEDLMIRGGELILLAILLYRVVKKELKP